MASFLRKLWECFTVWYVPPSRDLYKGDVIISHAGGVALDGSPGKINEHLEAVIRGLHHNNPALKVIAQGELVPCLGGLPVVGNIPTQQEALPAYIDTVDVTEIFKKLCDKNGWKHPILVSYQPHMWRGLKVCEKLGMKNVLVAPTAGIYDPNCSQRWMISPRLNTPRELACRLVWLLQGKI